MAALSQQRCEACTPGTPVLTTDEIATLRQELSDAWRVEDDRLTRRLRFATFTAAFARATQVAAIADAENHHPDMCVGWGYLDLSITTHAVGGLSRNDFILAAKIDALDR